MPHADAPAPRAQVRAIVGVDHGPTGNLTRDAIAQWTSEPLTCAAPAYEVVTLRSSGSAPEGHTNSIAFTIAVP